MHFYLRAYSVDDGFNEHGPTVRRAASVRRGCLPSHVGQHPWWVHCTGESSRNSRGCCPGVASVLLSEMIRLDPSKSFCDTETCHFVLHLPPLQAPARLRFVSKTISAPRCWVLCPVQCSMALALEGHSGAFRSELA